MPVSRHISTVTESVTEMKPSAQVRHCVTGTVLALLLVTERAAHSGRGLKIRYKVSV